MKKETVIVIGAGIAGLVAAKELSAYFDVVILEALSRFGGRIDTITDSGFSLPVESGAEFVHGQAENSIELLEEAKLSYQPVEGTFYKITKGRLMKQEEMVQGWDILLSKMAGLREDMTLQQFLSTYFEGERNAEIRKQAIAFAEGFDIAAIEKVSVQSLYKEWSDQSGDNRVDGGYSKLVEYLVEECRKMGCTLITNSIVKEIDWTGEQVLVKTLNNIIYGGEYCVVTASVGILQSATSKSAITFTPALPEYMSAFHQIGFGNVVKVVLEFTEVFWDKDAGFFFSDEQFPTWWTQLPMEVPLLTGWAGGPAADLLKELNEAELLDVAIRSVSSIFNLSIEDIQKKIKAAQVFNWHNEPFTAGAYSYHLPETPEALDILTLPVGGKLYFAGEGLYSGSQPGTVEAAIVSAKDVAGRLKKDKFNSIASFI